MSYFHTKSDPKSPWLPRDHSLGNKTGSWRSLRPIIDMNLCTMCGNCWIFCPDGAIILHEESVEVNLDYCKGCGICAVECKPGTIKMVREEV